MISIQLTFDTVLEARSFFNQPNPESIYRTHLPEHVLDYIKDNSKPKSQRQPLEHITQEQKVEIIRLNEKGMSCDEIKGLTGVMNGRQINGIITASKHPLLGRMAAPPGLALAGIPPEAKLDSSNHIVESNELIQEENEVDFEVTSEPNVLDVLGTSDTSKPKRGRSPKATERPKVEVNHSRIESYPKGIGKAKRIELRPKGLTDKQIDNIILDWAEGGAMDYEISRRLEQEHPGICLTPREISLKIQGFRKEGLI